MTDLLDRPARPPLAPNQFTGRHPITVQSGPTAPNRSSIPKLAQPQGVLLLLPLRLFLAAGWLRAGAEKLIEPEWWNGHALREFLVDQNELALPFFRPVMEHAIAPAATVVAFVVLVTQLCCGVAIGLGERMRLALRWGFLLNITFIVAGRVNPSAFYLVMQAVLLLAIADGTIGENPSTPSRWTVAAAGTAAALGLAVIPYVRTIDPAKVIDDPAMMLSFIGTVVAATLLFRRAAYRPHRSKWLHRLWTGRIADWMYAKPTRLAYVRPAASPAHNAQRPLPPPAPRRCSFAPPSIDTLVAAGRSGGQYAD